MTLNTDHNDTNISDNRHNDRQHYDNKHNCHFVVPRYSVIMLSVVLQSVLSPFAVKAISLQKKQFNLKFAGKAVSLHD
jgi:hypothetical protein